MPVTAGALLTSVSINGSVGLGCLLVFGVLRKWKLTEKLYEPKRCVQQSRVVMKQFSCSCYERQGCFRAFASSKGCTALLLASPPPLHPWVHAC